MDGRNKKKNAGVPKKNNASKVCEFIKKGPVPFFRMELQDNELQLPS